MSKVVSRCPCSDRLHVGEQLGAVVASEAESEDTGVKTLPQRCDHLLVIDHAHVGLSVCEQKQTLQAVILHVCCRQLWHSYEELPVASHHCVMPLTVCSPAHAGL